MRAGTLSDRITFQARSVTGEGETRAITYVDAFTVAAEPQRTSETNCRFIIRYRSGIGPETHRIIWDGVRWNITSAVHDLRKTMLTVDCDFSEAIEATTLDSTEREYVDGLPLVHTKDE